MSTPRPSRALASVLLAVLVAGGTAGCGDDAPTPSAEAPSAAPSPAGSAAPPTGGTPSAPVAATAPSTARTVVEGGIRLQVPAGWQATALTETARAQALAREKDPRVAEFLRQRLDGLAQQGAVLYLYDLGRVSSGTLATAEVYRYPAGRSPQQALEQIVLPRLVQAGFSPVRGQTTLPAGPALTLTTTTQASGRDLRNEFHVLALSGTTVGLSVTTVGPQRPDAAQLPRGLAAA